MKWNKVKYPYSSNHQHVSHQFISSIHFKALHINCFPVPAVVTHTTNTNPQVLIPGSTANTCQFPNAPLLIWINLCRISKLCPFCYIIHSKWTNTVLIAQCTHQNTRNRFLTMTFLTLTKKSSLHVITLIMPEPLLKATAGVKYEK